MSVSSPTAQLFAAIEAKDLPAVSASIASGADIYSENALFQKLCELILSHAAALSEAGSLESALLKVAGHHESFNGTLIFDPLMVPFLVKNGAQVNAKCSLGVAALHIAAGSANAPVLRQLLDRGADVNIVDDNNRTALHWSDDCVTAALLLEADIDTSIVDKFGETAELRATQEGSDPAVHALIRSARHHSEMETSVIGARPPSPRRI
jgi:ankyrin repeat protein